MTKCLICPNDISDQIQQFGDPRAPLCQSCYLADNSWVQEYPRVVDELQHGIEFEIAVEAARLEETSDLQKFAESFFLNSWRMKHAKNYYSHHIMALV